MGIQVKIQRPEKLVVFKKDLQRYTSSTGKQRRNTLSDLCRTLFLVMFLAKGVLPGFSKNASEKSVFFKILQRRMSVFEPENHAGIFIHGKI